jgi:hypothetical protein
VKARNHPRVASALPHSEGIAYKPLCGEIAMYSRVGRMGSIKCRLSDDGPRQHNSDQSEDPWGRCAIELSARHCAGLRKKSRGARAVDANQTPTSACREQA